jgi:hypothetical protein
MHTLHIMDNIKQSQRFLRKNNENDQYNQHK